MPAASSDLVLISTKDGITTLTFNRAAKRNALSNELVAMLSQAFDTLDRSTRVIVLDAAGEHFCAGLDLGSLGDYDAVEGMRHSHTWHAAFHKIQFSGIPVIAALKGAVVGGGCELAAACHIRVADDTAFFGLPEGTRGLFLGGSGSVRIPKLIGMARVTDMMLTGRVLKAAEAERVGLVQYHVPAGEALAKAQELARKVAANAPTSNYAITAVLPRIGELSTENGLLMESMIAGMSQAAPEAKERMRAFLEGRAAKVQA